MPPAPDAPTPTPIAAVTAIGTDSRLVRPCCDALIEMSALAPVVRSLELLTRAARAERETERSVVEVTPRRFSALVAPTPTATAPTPPATEPDTATTLASTA